MPYPDFRDKIRISAVSYTNTRPFVYGIRHAKLLDDIELSLDTPSECAQKLIDDEADIGLIPVAALLKIPDHHIITDFCIGADGPVNSVFIFSNKPVSELTTLKLDRQSRTSNNLAKVLLKNFWKTVPEFVTEGDADAFVEIGDRTFGKADKYPFVYDLAQEWKKFTGLPFTFAVWASNKPIPADFIADFNEALQVGIDHIDEVLTELPEVSDFDLSDYLKNKLQFNLDGRKREALNLFLSMLKDL